MRDFIYYTPTKVFFGSESETKTGDIVGEYGFKKILLHYGKGSIKKSGVYDTVCESLKNHKIDIIELGGVEPNPKLDLVKEGIKICIRENVDAVIAVGGGSVIDSAKLIAIGAKHPKKDPWKFVSKEIEPKTALPVGVVLTLAAAGSEMSSSCVITNEKLNMKRGFGSDFNRPLFTIMNPKITYTVPPYETATGVVDILMHTMERYFQPEPNSCLTDGISEAIMKNVISAGKIVMERPDDYEARATLMWGSSLSHNGITGAGKREFLQLHQLEHEISGLYDEVSHGAGLSALFNSWALKIYSNDIEKFVKFAVNVWGCKDNKDDKENVALEGIKKCTEFFSKTLKLPVSLKELGIDGTHVDLMTNNCSHNGKRVLPGALDLDEGDIREIFINSLN